MLECETTDAPATWRSLPHLPRLDARDRRILELTLAGASLKQIAIELGLSSARACRVRRAALFRMGFHDLYAFVYASMQNAVPGFEPPRPRLAASVGLLSQSESEVAELARLGLSNAAIAARRGVSPRTVANQLSSLFRKLGVQSRLELVLALSLPLVYGGRHTLTPGSVGELTQP